MRNKYWTGEYGSRGQVVAGGGGRLATVVSIPGRQVFTLRVPHTNCNGWFRGTEIYLWLGIHI